MKKNIKKFALPEILVDHTDCNSIAEVYAEVVCAVIEKYCTHAEYEAFESLVKPKFVVCVCEGECPFCNPKPAKKPNVFKRFWNWLTHKK